MGRFLSAFVAVTCAPLVLLALAAGFGGGWVVAALVYLLLTGVLVDPLLSRLEEEPSHAPVNALPVLLALSHFALLAGVVQVLAGDGLGLVEKLGLFYATSLYLGATSNGVAHELIHRANRWQRGLGRWMFISHLFGHHTSAHMLVHHIHVGTRADPNTARRGESYYRFWRRAWKGSFWRGLKAENARRARAGVSGWRTHPYTVYILGAAGFVLIAGALSGPAGVAWYVALAFMAQSGLLLTDYVQHYGLMRRDRNGKPEPVNGLHSWNSPHWFVSKLTLNAVRHSDHHARPDKAFTALEPKVDGLGPELPYAANIMSLIALYPPAWRRIMDPRADAVMETP